MEIKGMRKNILMILSSFFIMFIFLSMKENDFCKLIINRYECNGRMNSICCDIIIEKQNGNGFSTYADYTISDFEILETPCTFDKDTLSLGGGEKIELLIQPGKYRIKCVTPIENQHEYLKEKMIWESEYLYLDLKQGSSIGLDIFPGSNESGYSGTWVVKNNNVDFYYPLP